MNTIKTVQFIGRPPVIAGQTINGYLHATSYDVESIALSADGQHVVVRTKRDVVVIPAVHCYITYDNYSEGRETSHVPRGTLTPADVSRGTSTPDVEQPPKPTVKRRRSSLMNMNWEDPNG